MERSRRREDPRSRIRAEVARLAVWLGAAAALLGCGAPGGPPNIVLYVVDTLRRDGLEPYGNPAVATPAARRLAREGILFERAYAPASWTRPSITSLLSGRPPDVHGVETREHRAPDSLRLLPELLREAGYATAAIVTNPNVGAFFGFDQGYDDFIELFEHRERGPVSSGQARARSDVVTARSIDWIGRARRPFFLFVLTTDPHAPYAPPAGYDRFRSEDDPRERGPSYRRVPRVERDRSRYYGEIAFNDHSFGALLDHLQETGLYDETLVVLTSDHGEAFGEHGYRWHGKTLFEELVRVPLILRRPGEREPGRRVAAPVQLVDLAPTLLQAAGLEIPEELEGQVLPPGAQAAEREVFARLELDGYASEMIIAYPWKWISSRAQPASDPHQLGGLYHLERDPFESVDAGAEHPEVVATLRRRLEERADRNAPRSAALAADGAMPREVRDALEALGYLETESGGDQDAGIR